LLCQRIKLSGFDIGFEPAVPSVALNTPANPLDLAAYRLVEL
jgi:hypothetical protein